MSSKSDDERAFDETIAGLGLPMNPVAMDATMVPDEPQSWSSFRGSAGLLPAVGAKPLAAGQDVELSLLELLGEGGMGKVYLAMQRSLGRKVAVKTVKDALSERAVAALCDEAVVTGRLAHPNIIPVHALAQDDEGRPLLIMKRVEGVGWNVLLAEPDHAFWSRNEIAEDDRLLYHVDVLRRVAHAATLAHSRGIVHRDIKPENVMLGDFGEVYLVDWGIAARVGTHVGDKLAGTPYYLAPEMLGGTVDAQTDVFLLGATLHEILTGQPPHQGATLTQVLFSAFTSAPPEYGPEVPEELAALATQAMARDKDARPSSARAFGDALDDFVRHRGSRALSRTGEARLAALEKMIEGVPVASRDLGELRRLIAECRFAFQQARREWADNPAVAPGLTACAKLAVRVELDRRDGEAARAMLRELEAPPPALVAQVEALEAELAREAEERSRLANLAKELDPRIERTVQIFGGAVVAAAVVAIGVYARTVDEVTKTHAFVLGLGMLCAMAFLLVVLWRRVTRNLFNRRFAGWVAVTITSVLLHRFVALYDPGATLESVLTTDLVLLAAFWAIGALFIFRWMFFVGLGFALSLWPALAYPAHVATLFSAINFVAIAIFALAWGRTQRGDSPS